MHPKAWVMWLLAAVVPAFTVRNPLYLILVLGAAWVVYLTLGRTTVGASWGSFVKVGLFFLAVSLVFNMISTHVGQHVLFRLPAAWPIVGGAITLEAAVAGLVNGLALLTILIVFATFNAGVDHYQLLRSIPAFLFQVGVVLSIAVTFVPHMVWSAQEIRQVQRIRGHRFRGVRDLLPLVLPLLANSLERAVQLAEAMEARGFGSVADSVPRRRVLGLQIGLVGALLAVLGGLSILSFFSGDGWWGWAMVVGGAIGALMILGAWGRLSRRTNYRRVPWTWRDTAVVATSAGALAAVVLAQLARVEALTYNPFSPHGLWPAFDARLGMALLGLALPALRGLTGPQGEEPSTGPAVGSGFGHWPSPPDGGGSGTTEDIA